MGRVELHVARSSQPVDDRCCFYPLVQTWCISSVKRSANAKKRLSWTAQSKNKWRAASTLISASLAHTSTTSHASRLSPAQAAEFVPRLCMGADSFVQWPSGVPILPVGSVNWQRIVLGFVFAIAFISSSTTRCRELVTCSCEICDISWCCLRTCICADSPLCLPRLTFC